MLTHSEISNFNKYGFLIKRMYLAESCLDEMQHVAVHHLENHISPIEPWIMILLLLEVVPLAVF